MPTSLMRIFEFGIIKPATIKNAAEEMAQVAEFDFVIINELFESALFDLKAIIHAQRLKYAAQRRLRADTFESLNIPESN